MHSFMHKYNAQCPAQFQPMHSLVLIINYFTSVHKALKVSQVTEERART